MAVAPVASRAARAERVGSTRPRAGSGAAVFLPLEIAVDRCKGCELCLLVCPKGVLVLDLSVVNWLGHHPVRLTDASGCTSCAFCARICPDAVFTVYARPKES
jgi:2-oxoglutarate ferredoxin oxidoreductase subunit delta